MGPADGPQQLSILAAVTVDAETGQLRVDAAPGVDATIVFADAIKAMRVMQLQGEEKHRPKIARAVGPLPPFPAGRVG